MENRAGPHGEPVRLGRQREDQFHEAEDRTEFRHGPGYDHPGIRDDDLDDAFERVDHAGVVRPPQDDPSSGERFAFIEDPFGNVIGRFSPFDDPHLYRPAVKATPPSTRTSSPVM